MLKKLFITSLLSIIICSTVFAERKITCDYENENAVSYHVYSANNAHAGNMYIKQFVKYIDANNNEEYWYKIGVEEVTRFMPYMDILIDDKEYRVKIIDNMDFRHLWAGADADAVPKSCVCYSLPNDIIEAMSKAKKPIILVVHRQTVQGIVLKSDSNLNQCIQKIISLKYADKDSYLVKRDVRKD